MHMAHHHKTIWLDLVTVEVGAASYFWDPRRYFGLAGDLMSTKGILSEDRMVEAVKKMKEYTFSSLCGWSGNLWRMLPFRKGKSFTWTWSSVKVVASIGICSSHIKVVTLSSDRDVHSMSCWNAVGGLVYNTVVLKLNMELWLQFSCERWRNLEC